MSAEVPEAGHNHDQEGLYVFFFAHNSQVDVEKKMVRLSVWQHSCYADTVLEAKKSLEDAAQLMGLLDKVRSSPRDIHFQFFSVDHLDEMIGYIDEEDLRVPDAVVFTDKEITMQTEESTEKNILMQKLIKAGNAKELHKYKNKLSRGELRYVRDRIK